MPTREQRAERVKAADQVEHHQREEGEMRDPAGAAHRAQETGIDAFEHQRAIDQRQRRSALTVALAAITSSCRHSSTADCAEQEMQQLDVRAVDRHDHHAERKRHQKEHRQRGVLLAVRSCARSPRPRATAMRSPAISPPTVMAKRLSPAARNPIAAPGRMACAIASPTRLMRRSIRNTPTGPALKRERQHGRPASGASIQFAERLKRKHGTAWRL